MELTDVQFKESVFDYEDFQVKSNKPVVVDLYTDWCTACKSLNPALDRVAQKFEGIVDVIKVNITRSDALASALDIQSVPTLLFLQPGRKGPIRTLVGATTPALVEKTIAEYLL